MQSVPQFTRTVYPEKDQIRIDIVNYLNNIRKNISDLQKEEETYQHFLDEMFPHSKVQKLTQTDAVIEIFREQSLNGNKSLRIEQIYELLPSKGFNIAHIKTLYPFMSNLVESKKYPVTINEDQSYSFQES